MVVSTSKIRDVSPAQISYKFPDQGAALLPAVSLNTSEIGDDTLHKHVESRWNQIITISKHLIRYWTNETHWSPVCGSVASTLWCRDHGPRPTLTGAGLTNATNYIGRCLQRSHRQLATTAKSESALWLSSWAIRSRRRAFQQLRLLSRMSWTELSIGDGKWNNTYTEFLRGGFLHQRTCPLRNLIIPRNLSTAFENSTFWEI